MKKINKCLLALFLFLGSITAYGQNYTFTNMPSVPQNMYSPGQFTIDSIIYVLGGWEVSVIAIGGYPVPLDKHLYAFNTNTRTWSQKGDFPGTPTYGTSAFTIGHYGYIVNGWDSTGSGRGPATTWQYDPSNDTWTAKAAFGGATRYTTGAFALAGKGYITCGFSPYTNDTWCFDPIANTWTQKASFPGGVRQAMTFFAINDIGYAGMGNTSDGMGSYFVKSDWYKYDPTTDVWTALSPFPGDAVGAPSSFIVNGEAYVVGGLSQRSIYYSNSVDASDKVWKYTPSSDTWSLWGVFPDSAFFGGTYGQGSGAGFVGLGARNFSDYPLTRKFYRFGPGIAPYSCNVTLNTISISNAVYNFQANGNFSPTAELTWNFGDGSTGTGTSVIHNYTSAGHYTITVNVNDTATACSNSATDTVNVTGISSCATTINHTRYGSLYTLSTSVTGAVGPYSYQWSTSSDTTFSSTAPNPLVSIPVNTPTTYCVSVTDATGCVATACTTIADSQFVYTPCQIFVAVYPDPYVPGSYYAVLYTTGATNLSYLWDFGDGSTSTQEFPSHVYSTPGQYTVCLTVTDGAGCSFTFCDSSFYAYKYGGGPMQRFSVTQQITLGIKDGGNTTVSLYPNPTNSIVNIDAAGQKITGAVVYNINGQRVMDVENPSQNSLNVSQLPDGIYMVEVKTRDASAKVKFAKVTR